MFTLMPWRRERRGSISPAPRIEHPLSVFGRHLDEWLEGAFGRWPRFLEESWMAREGMEIEETGEAFLVKIDAPGFEAKDFEIRVSGETLTIEAEHKVEGEGKAPMTERRLSRFVTLPASVAPEKVEARYVNGVLELTLPRTEAAKPRKVEVKAA